MKTLKSINAMFKFFSTIMIMLTLSFGSVSIAYADPANTNSNTYSANAEKSHYSDQDYVDTYKKGSMMDWVMLIVSSIISANLAANCKITADILAGSAAGAIEIMGEIYEFANDTNGLEENHADYNAGNLSDSQRQALIEIREGYADAAEVLETKQVIQQTAAAAYLIAAVTAGAGYIAYELASDACIAEKSTSISADATVCAGYTAPPAIAACEAGVAACSGGVAAGQGVCKLQDAKDLLPGLTSSTDMTMRVTAIDEMLASEQTCQPPYANATKLATVACTGSLHSLVNMVYTACNPAFYFTDNTDLYKGIMNKKVYTIALEQIKRKSAIMFGAPLMEKMKDFGFLSLNDRFKNSFTNVSSWDEYINYRDQYRMTENESHSTTIDEYNRYLELSMMVPEENREGFVSSAVLNGVDLVFPQAHALDYFKALGIVGPLVGVFLLSKTALGKLVDSYVAKPWVRALMWGILAGYTYSAASTTEEQYTTLYDNIDKINGILTALNAHTSETATQYGNGPATGSTGYSENGSTGPNVQPDFKEAICVQTDKSSGECVSMEKLNKKTSSKLEKAPYMPKNKELSQARALTSMVMDAISKDTKNGKLTAGTLDMAKQLGQKAASLKNMLKKQNEDINKMRKEKGLKPLDLDGMKNAMAAKMREVTAGPMKSKSITPSQLVSGLFPHKGNMVDKKEKDENMSSKGKVVKVDGKGKNEEKKEEKMLNLAAFEDDKLETIEGENKADEVSSADELAKLNYDVEDIVKNKDVSIFTVLTSRYFNSAYPRFFKKKQKDDDIPVEEK